jgi:hypothetical protein
VEETAAPPQSTAGKSTAACPDVFCREATPACQLRNAD